VIKMGRTQLQDAGADDAGSGVHGVRRDNGEDIARLRETARLFLEVNMGGDRGHQVPASTHDPRYPQLVGRAPSPEHRPRRPSLPRTWSRRRPRHRRVRDVLGRA